MPTEFHSLAECVYDEMKARGWTSEQVAVLMGTRNGPAMDLFCVALLLAVQDDALIIDNEIFDGLARAFGVKSEVFRNIHAQWLANPNCRVAFDCPDDAFGPISRRGMIRVVQ